MSIYANNASVQAQRQSQSRIDEARYQTIGRGHGFSELEGVPFQLSDKFHYTKGLHSSLYQVDNLHLDYSRVADGGFPERFITMPCTLIKNKIEMLRNACSKATLYYKYTFDLERKVLVNMANKRL